MIGGVGKGVGELSELQVRWIGNPLWEARGFGWRTEEFHVPSMASEGRGRVNQERERERARERAWVGKGRCATSMPRTGMAGKELDGRHVATTDEPRSRSG